MRMLRMALVLVAVAGAACSQKWGEIEFEDQGFAAEFPMPVQSAQEGKSKKYWGWAGDTQVIVTVTRLGKGMVETLGGPRAVLNRYYKSLKETAEDRSPSAFVRFQEKHLALDYHLEAKFGDGTTRELRSRAVVSGDTLYVMSASWPLKNKKGPAHADRVLPTFRLL